MNRTLRSISVLGLLSVFGAIVSPAASAEAAQELPPPFEINEGQASPEFRYLVRDGGYMLGFAPEGIQIWPGGRESGPGFGMELLGGNRSPELSGERKLPGKVHYLVGSNPFEWITGIPTWSAVRYHSVYDGVDLQVGGRRGALDFTFELEPSTAHEVIVLGLSGPEPVRLDHRGHMLAGGRIRFLAPVAMQQVNGEEVFIRGRFHLLEGGRIAIELTGRDMDLPLSIRIRMRSDTYTLGQPSREHAPFLAVAPDGDVVVAGLTVTPGPGEAYVTRLTDGERAERFTTYFGGRGEEQVRGVTVDPAGRIVVSGWTQSGSDFPAAGGTARDSGDGRDKFVARISADGTRIDRAGDVDIAPDGSILVGPNTGDAFHPEFGGTTDTIDVPVLEQPRARLAGGRAPRGSAHPGGPARLHSPDFGSAALSDSTGSTLMHTEYGQQLGLRTVDAIRLRGDGVLVLGRGASVDSGRVTAVASDPAGHGVFLGRAASDDASLLVAGCPGTINFDNSIGNLLWTEASNWDTDLLPVTDDDACIDGYEVTLWSGTQGVASLFVTPTGGLLHRAGTLILNTPSEIQGDLTLDLDLGSGRIEGPGPLTVSGPIDWFEGVFAVTGGVLATAPVRISGPFSATVSEGSFTNTTLVEWLQGWVGVAGTATMVNDGTWEVTSDSVMNNQNSPDSRFVNNGLLRKSGTTGTTDLRVYLESPGTVDIQAGILQLAGGGSISGSITGPGELAITGGTCDLQASSVLALPQITVGGGTVNIDGELDVPGTLTANGGRINFNSGAVITALGNLVSRATLYFNTGSSFPLQEVTLTGGTFTGADDLVINGTFDWIGGTVSVAGGVVANGTVNMTGAGRHTVWSSMFRNTATVNLSDTGMAEAVSGAAFTNDGTWEVTNDANIFTPNIAGSVFTNNGAFRKSATSGTTEIGMNFDNYGTVEVLAGTLRIRDAFVQYSGSTLLNGGSMAGSTNARYRTVDIRAGLFGGVGTMTGDMLCAGTMSPGLSAGSLTVDGNYTQTAAGDLAIELGGLTAGTQYDQLVVTGSAILDGALNVALIDGFVPGEGDSFAILQGSSITGMFATLNLPALPGGTGWEVTYNATSVVLSAGAATCPDTDNDGYALCDGSCSLAAGGQCGDCDDSDAAINPDAAEITCDGIDQNCNGLSDDGPDGDGDGYSECVDCDDTDPAINPGATEITCDDIDQNCNGMADDTPDGDGDGFTACEECDDTDAAVNPGAVEITCDDIDQNCNGMADDTPDGDGDGYSECVDCDDGDPAVNPGAAELCTDGADNDCDDLVDAADVADCGTTGSRTICAALGDDPADPDLDRDVYEFTAAAGEVVTLTLDPVNAPSQPGRAALILFDASGEGDLVGSDRTTLPNSLDMTTLAAGEYRVGVYEEPGISFLEGRRYSGPYCLTLDSSLNAARTLEPTASVEGVELRTSEPDPPSRTPAPGRILDREASPDRIRRR